MKLISSCSLQSTLRNITLHMPEGYELIAGTRTEDIYQYYKFRKCQLLPISTALNALYIFPSSQQITPSRYIIIILPERISSDKYVQYAIEYPYLAIQVRQHGYIPFTEKDYTKCVTSVITVCPLYSAIFNTQRLTCAASLFFQIPNHQQLCERNLLFNYQQSTMIRHRNVWIYHFPTP